MSNQWSLKLAWSDVEPYLNQALELEPAARTAWLAELHSTQPTLAGLLRSLLEEHDAHFLSQASLATVEPNADGDHDAGEPQARPGEFATGVVVGPYRLLRQIGCGGMSSVWLAERCDGQLKRHVALKLPLFGLRMQLERGEFTQAEERLTRSRTLLGSSLPPDSVPLVGLKLQFARLAAEQGNVVEANRLFAEVLAGKASDFSAMIAKLGKAEVELQSGAAAAALGNAEAALRSATTMQGSLPHSRHSGLAWLTLGKVRQHKGESQLARAAFQQAIAHLSNTVDDDHPRLAQARRALAELSEAHNTAS